MIEVRPGRKAYCKICEKPIQSKEPRIVETPETDYRMSLHYHIECYKVHTDKVRDVLSHLIPFTIKVYAKGELGKTLTEDEKQVIFDRYSLLRGMTKTQLARFLTHEKIGTPE